jgi:hypothetical protein
MILEFLLQFVVELMRALLVDELSRRVRSMARRPADIGHTLMGVHRRNRERLLNRLLTDLKDDL